MGESRGRIYCKYNLCPTGVPWRDHCRRRHDAKLLEWKVQIHPEEFPGNEQRMQYNNDPQFR